MINTIRGEMDEKLLTKRTGNIDNDNENTSWVEYWLNEELMHRSVHVALKQPIISTTDIGKF
jgi:hypothetical protein